MIKDLLEQDDLFIEEKLVTQAYVRKNYLSRILHVGKYGDSICPSCSNKDKACIDNFIEQHGKDKTYYALINDDKFSVVFVNLNYDEPISQAYNFNK